MGHGRYLQHWILRLCFPVRKLMTASLRDVPAAGNCSYRGGGFASVLVGWAGLPRVYLPGDAWEHGAVHPILSPRGGHMDPSGQSTPEWEGRPLCVSSCAPLRGLS